MRHYDLYEVRQTLNTKDNTLVIRIVKHLYNTGETVVVLYATYLDFHNFCNNMPNFISNHVECCHDIKFGIKAVQKSVKEVKQTLGHIQYKFTTFMAKDI